MAQELNGIRIAILATDGFEQSELTGPKKAVEAAGATTEIIAPKDGEIRGWNSTDWGESVKVDKIVDRANAADYDLLLLPGGVLSPDKLRIDSKAMQFVRDYEQTGKPIAAICHGPRSLVETGFVNGRKLTSWPSLQTDIRNAGGDWVDEQVVVDGNLITSRKPDDIPAFSQAIIQQLGSGALRKAS